MRHRFVALTALLVVALALTACSNTGSATTPAGPSTTSADSTSTSGGMSSSNPDAAQLLSVADVQKASGIAGVKLVAENSSKDAVGRLNFANSDGTLITTMNIGDGTAFNQALSGMLFSRESTGTGSMCFVGPSAKVSKVLSVFAAAKGDHAVIMKTFAKTKGGTETWLTIDQLQSLAGLVLSRWQ
jgi:hypothetical protein